MYASNYLEQTFLNCFNGTGATAPQNLYLRLFSSNPTDTGLAGTEISYTGYQPQEITFSAPENYSSGLAIANASQIEFAIAGEDVGNITHIGIFDSSTGGNMLVYGELNEVLNIKQGESPIFLAGEIKFYNTGNLSTYYKRVFLNFLRNTNLPAITPYFSLFSGNPESGGVELTGDNYSRPSITFSAPYDTATGVMQIKNSAQIEFNRASSNWGNSDYRCIFDASSSGQCVWFKQATLRDFNTGRKYIISAENLLVGVN